MASNAADMATVTATGGIEMSAVIDFKQKQKQGEIQPIICLDIETCAADAESIEQEIALWKAPSNWKAETVEAKREEYVAKVAERSALLDSAPVASIALCDDHGGAVVFHWLLPESGEAEEGYFSKRLADEREMLLAFRDWANASTDESTVIVGFNLKFDLPHLRIAYTRHGIKLPRLLAPRQGNQISDVMYLFTKYFTSKDLAFIGLDEVAKRLGIAPEGKQLDGADVPVYIERGFAENDPMPHRDVITYNAIDTLLTMRAFLVMTGQAEDMR